MNSSLFIHLKEVTSGLHIQVEEHIGIQDKDITLDQYKKYLQFLYTFYRENENQLLYFVEVFPQLEIIQRLKKIRHGDGLILRNFLNQIRR